MEFKNKIINVLGDSITFGVGASSLENSYVGLLKKEYGDCTVNNYGISGTRIARRREPYTVFPEADQDFLSRIDGMQRNADLVVVFGGVNDYGHGDATLGDVNDYDPYTFCGALNILFKELYLQYPEAKFLMMTPLHKIDEDKKNSLGLTLVDYVEAIKKVAAKYAVPVVDLYSRSGICPVDEDLKLLDTTDGLHPNDKGHKKIFNLLNNYIKYVL